MRDNTIKVTTMGYGNGCESFTMNLVGLSCIYAQVTHEPS